ncbi:hypothetical protein BX261_7280 [Streptomyces sp. 2321.6]|uniref:MarR family transcriptional regulator n=1 Tax=Streptomyces sp. 2321.6 TaxID=1938840 RepID=UPI000BC77907|nr:MarR family transcriptional regulator [Streptomyces sp. 2321.6]PBC72406.1 hypothetical protein BX261_7280 [Streptomyces sp. 2321.6]
MPPTRRRRLALVDQDTGEVVEPKPRTPHQFDGRGYTLQSKGDEVPLYSLKLTAAEWAAIDWLREHDAAHAYVKVTPEELAKDILSNPTTARKALARLVKLKLVLKPSPRASAYQLTPRRYWEGAGSTQATASKRLAPPRITPDEKAVARAAQKAAAAERSTQAEPKTPRPRRAAGEAANR